MDNSRLAGAVATRALSSAGAGSLSLGPHLWHQDRRLGSPSMSKPYKVGGVALVLLLGAYFWIADPSFDDRWDITGLATVLLAATTAFLAFTTRGEAQATTALEGITAAQLERSHRPVLAPSSVGPRVTLAGKVELEFENVGMGPALSIHVEIAGAGWPDRGEVRSESRGPPGWRGSARAHRLA
jgi:hypothetical protein